MKEQPFSNANSYAGDARGAVWNRWDLHVHTPASIEQHYGDGRQDATWDKYIEALASLPAEIRAIGINDYFSIAGYRRVLEARHAGKLPNLELIFPVIELRLASFVGNRKVSKLNYHVLFSDLVPADQIETFFLRDLKLDLALTDHENWCGCVGTPEGMADLGRAMKAATPEHRRGGQSDLRVGFHNAAVEFKTVTDALEASVFRDNYLTALGYSEFAEMSWTDAAAQKRDAAGRVDFLLTASPSSDQYRKSRERLQAEQLNDRLIDGSDAHYHGSSPEPNRLGAGRTWIKADLTFQGLKHALRKFDRRVFVGATPPKIERVAQNRTKYIDRVVIRKRVGASLNETWFDADVPINHDLVAVIGNQGSGKSALTDVIALCGQTASREFSFLHADKFRDKQKRASQFDATIEWADGTKSVMRLDQNPPASSPERVRYIPQGFFDTVTNELEAAEDSRFYTEIKRAIFSHMPDEDRLGESCLNDLIRVHTEAAEKDLAERRAALKELNTRIVAEQGACAPAEIDKIDAEIGRVTAEIQALEASPPPAVPAPNESAEESREIELLLAEAQSLEATIKEARIERTLLSKKRTTVDQALQNLRNLERRVREDLKTIDKTLRGQGVEVDLTTAFTVTTDFTSLETTRAEADSRCVALDEQLDDAGNGTPAKLLADNAHRRTALQNQSDAAAGAYQNYLGRRDEWQFRLAALGGSGDEPDSVEGLKDRRRELVETRPLLLSQMIVERREKSRDIYGVIRGLADVHERIARPVRKHIHEQPLTRDRYRLAFDVQVTANSFAERLFRLVLQTSGTFRGQQDGRELLQTMLDAADFTTVDGALTFADQLIERLERDYSRGTPAPFDLAHSLKKDGDLTAVYDLVYGLEYLHPAFELGLNGKSLKQLSPGERGILLLVFYLVVDRGDEPLIIDQPEGNLNNQSIFDHLVPVIMSAKERRQIIIVTHNPNIAVVCDAEQIVHCEMAQDGSHRVKYETGAIENPRFNKLSLDLLEGTGDALDARVTTYDRALRRRAGGVQLAVRGTLGS